MFKELEIKASIGMPYTLFFMKSDDGEEILFLKKDKHVGTIAWHEEQDHIAVDTVDVDEGHDFIAVGKIFRRYFQHLACKLDKEIHVVFIDHQQQNFKKLGYEHIQNDTENYYLFRYVK